MTIKQQINHGDIQKVCHLHNDIFHSIHLCHTLPTLLYHLPCIIKNIKNMAASEYHVISKEVEKLLQAQSHFYTVYTTHIDKVVGL